MKCIRRPQVTGLRTSPVVEEASCREYAITAVFDVLGGPGAAPLSASGICVGRFLGEGDYTDLINYHRKKTANIIKV